MIVNERGSAGSIGSKGLVQRKNNEAPRSFDSASRRRHFERSREIYIAERSLPDVRQHQDIVFPWRIHSDFLQYSKDPSATLGMTMLENPSHQSPVTSHS